MDLTTTYLGMKLRTPLVPSACGPLSNTLGKVRALEDAGASAIVMYSLFEEEIRHESQELDFYLTQGSYSYAEALDYFPIPERSTWDQTTTWITCTAQKLLSMFR